MSVRMKLVDEVLSNPSTPCLTLIGADHEAPIIDASLWI
jgi:hypothetical protein